jgi:hypothetical protein
MPNDQEAPPSKPEEPRKGRLLDWLDALAKLVGAGAVLAVALIANSFQSRLTGVSIQSQREQAESQLRANMFSSLIGPIAGPTGGKALSADREQLIAQLLALNFNENFELKPLLEDASQRMAPKGEPGHNSSGGPDPREPLWSVARRIAERQKASIAWEWSGSKANQQQQAGWRGRLFGCCRPRAKTTGTQACEAFTLTVDAQRQLSSEKSQAPGCQLVIGLGETVRLKSPDGNYTLQLTLVHPDWTNQTVDVLVWPFATSQGRPVDTDTTYRFTLGWFDFPFTDNTLLPDGNRFAVYLRLVSPDYSKVTVVAMWFPKGYFTPRERPLNYREVQELLGRTPQ